jgi:hypothetical protein
MKHIEGEFKGVNDVKIYFQVTHLQNILVDIKIL